MDPQETSPAGATPRRAGRTWRRIVVYTLALIGLLALLLVAAVAIHEHGQPAHSLDSTDTIDGVMTRHYGKYSEARQGWLYVDDSNSTYVVTVVQQKKIPGKDGDELYLVTSGRPLEASQRSTAPFYGVFQLTWRNGQLYEFGNATRYEGTQPVTPERVRFEALSAEVWGWVVKTVYEGDQVFEGTSTHNVFLAPHGDEIAVVAEFKAAEDVDLPMGCGEADLRHAAWLEARNKPKPKAAEAASAPASAASAADADEGENDEDEDAEPPRCTKLRWAYRTEPVADKLFTPIYVTRKAGLEEGQQTPEKNWKLMFDAKSFTYLLPPELKLD